MTLGKRLRNICVSGCDTGQEAYGALSRGLALAWEALRQLLWGNDTELSSGGGGVSEAKRWFQWRGWREHVRKEESRGTRGDRAAFKA